MNIGELIEELEYLAHEHGNDVEVRFASQPSWPFEYSVDFTVGVDLENNRTGEVEKVAYLVEGRQIGYLPGEVKDEIGW